MAATQLLPSSSHGIFTLPKLGTFIIWPNYIHLPTRCLLAPSHTYQAQHGILFCFALKTGIAADAASPK